MASIAGCGGSDRKADEERERVDHVSLHWVEHECRKGPIVDIDGELYDIPGEGCYYQRRYVDKLDDCSWRVRFSSAATSTAST